VNLTQPTLQEVLVFDPFFGFITPVLVPATQLLASIHRDALGGNLGAGFTIGLGSSGLKFYTESRYHYANTAYRATQIVPVTFGIRW
jgi:hypothetical protein